MSNRYDVVECDATFLEVHGGYDYIFTRTFIFCTCRIDMYIVHRSMSKNTTCKSGLL